MILGMGSISLNYSFSGVAATICILTGHVFLLKRFECQCNFKTRVNGIKPALRSLLKGGCMLNENQIKGKWKEVKGGIRALWGKITDDELETTKGDLESVKGLVREKHGESQSDINGKIERLLASFDNEVDRGKEGDTSSYMRNPTSERKSGEEWNARH
jgi:uncharacterized protein YjbJ (UPF0337 family)